FSPYTSQIPYRPVLGNHDGLFGGFSYWEDYFYPSTLPSESSNSSLWHRFDFGTDLHVFMLDLEWGTETYTEAQKTWFEAELAAIDPEDWIIVMSHAFYYASSTYYDDIPWFDNPEMIATFQPLFAANGVDLVLSGHDHQMEHMSQESVDYFIIGGLGGVFDKNATIMTEANSHFYNNTNHGFLDLQFLGNSVTASFRTPENDILYTTDIQK
ncbi:MAG: metallophosphoesterase, partial [Promethearchaeota archaeon]